MTVRLVRGSLFDSDAQTLVNPVNTVGVSGKGLAKEFAKRFPKAQREYVKVCRREKLAVGNFLLSANVTKQWVLHFPTKEHWRDPSELDFITRGLALFADTYRDYGITSIAFPALGCGNGGLAWEDVCPVMDRFLDPIDLPVAIHVPLPTNKKASAR